MVKLHKEIEAVVVGYNSDIAAGIAVVAALVADMGWETWKAREKKRCRCHKTSKRLERAAEEDKSLSWID